MRCPSHHSQTTVCPEESANILRQQFVPDHPPKERYHFPESVYFERLLHLVRWQLERCTPHLYDEAQCPWTE